jgi:putative ABC transport system substrate-binding protein
VFARVADPVLSGFVDSLAKPHGNVTGFSTFEPSMAGKWLQLLKEIVPGVAHVTLMFNPATIAGGGSDFLRFAEAAASPIGLEVKAARVHNVTEIERAIAAVAGDANGSLISLPDVFLAVHRELTIELAAHHRVPTIYQYRYYASSGGLMSYGTDAIDQYTRVAEYIDRILKGAKPAELPVQTPTKYELVINLKTAKALGLNVPLHLQQLADEVIE